MHWRMRGGGEPPHRHRVLALERLVLHLRFALHDAVEDVGHHVHALLARALGGELHERLELARGRGGAGRGVERLEHLHHRALRRLRRRARRGLQHRLGVRAAHDHQLVGPVLAAPPRFARPKSDGSIDVLTDIGDAGVVLGGAGISDEVSSIAGIIDGRHRRVRRPREHLARVALRRDRRATPHRTSPPRR